jgi:hypothetical protein
MKSNKYPAGWNEQSVRELIDHYEGQTDEEAAAEHLIACHYKDADSRGEADTPGPTGRENPAQG